jgi:outer membrane usher protein
MRLRQQNNNKKKLAVLIGSLLAASASAAQKPDVGYYKLTVDNSSVAVQDLARMYVVGTNYYMLKQDADAYQLRYSAKDITTIEGQLVVNLNNLGILTDMGSDLVLHANSENLPTTKHYFRRNEVTSKTVYTDSAFANYSFDVSKTGTSGNTSFYKTFADGVMYNANFNYNSAAKNPLSLLDLYREKYDRDNMTVTRIGTSYSGYNSLTNPVSFVGFQYKRDFNLDSNFIKNPTLAINGTADAKSYAELYVNEQNFGNITLNQGEFNFSEISSGQASNNSVKVVMKDINGNVRQVVTSNLVGSPYNLKTGVSSFSFEAGMLRLGNERLGGPFASGTYSYGINDQLTLEGHIEASREQRRVAANATYATRFGTVQYGAALGQGESLQKLQYSYQKGDFYGSLATVRSNRFHTFGNTSSYIPDQDIASIGYKVANTNVSLQHVRYGDNMSRDSLGFTRVIGRGTFSLSLDKSRNNKGFSFMFSMPLDGKNEWRTSTSLRSSGNGLETDVNLTRYAGYNGSSFYVDAAKSSSGEKLSGTYQYGSEHGLATVNVSSGATDARYEGSVVFDHGVHLSRTIYEGYALVDTKTPDLPISLNNIEMATTDAKGYAVIPNVPSTTDSRVSISVDSLPPEIQIEDAIATTIAPRFFKSDVKFKVKNTPLILVPAVALGGTVEIDGKEFFTTKQGIYFDDYEEGKEYTVTVKACKMRFHIVGKHKLNEKIQLKCEE